MKRWGVSPDDPVLAAEQHAIIEKAIGELPTPFRDVYVLADVEGLPNDEIGEMLGLSLPAVKSRLHRARLRMRDALAPHFEEIGRMTCRELHAVLYEFVGDELAAETRLTVEQHVSSCAHCGTYVETYRATITMTRSLPRASAVPPSLEQRLKKMLSDLGNV